MASLKSCIMERYSKCERRRIHTIHVYSFFSREDYASTPVQMDGTRDLENQVFPIKKNRDTLYDLVSRMYGKVMMLRLPVHSNIINNALQKSFKMNRTIFLLF